VHQYNDIGTSAFIDKINDHDPDTDGIKSIILVDHDANLEIGLNRDAKDRIFVSRLD
jgi:hypothetical protein